MAKRDGQLRRKRRLLVVVARRGCPPQTGSVHPSRIGSSRAGSSPSTTKIWSNGPEHIGSVTEEYQVRSTVVKYRYGTGAALVKYKCSNTTVCTVPTPQQYQHNARAAQCPHSTSRHTSLCYDSPSAVPVEHKYSTGTATNLPAQYQDGISAVSAHYRCCIRIWHTVLVLNHDACTLPPSNEKEVGSLLTTPIFELRAL